jgi:hypothetical protein
VCCWCFSIISGRLGICHVRSLSSFLWCCRALLLCLHICDTSVVNLDRMPSLWTVQSRQLAGSDSSQCGHVEVVSILFCYVIRHIVCAEPLSMDICFHVSTHSVWHGWHMRHISLLLTAGSIAEKRPCVPLQSLSHQFLLPDHSACNCFRGWYV